MTQRRSNSYEQLERTLNEFPPEEHVTTHMVLNGQVMAGGNPDMTPADVQRELADLTQGADTFKVLVSTLYDEVQNTAIVALNGTAEHIGDLAAFMATAGAASAR